MTRENILPQRIQQLPAARDGFGNKTQTRQSVLCPCGQEKAVYVWSWAGHGFYRCPGCGKDVLYNPGNFQVG
jgi:hypothetical protein